MKNNREEVILRDMEGIQMSMLKNLLKLKMNSLIGMDEREG